MNSGEHQYAWLRLNADGVLVGSLALLSASDLINPATADISMALGFVPPLIWLWTVMYVMGGLLMIVSFVRQSIGIEFSGRFLLFMGVVTETWRTATVLSWNHHEVIGLYVLNAILAIAFSLRVSTLLSRKGIVFKVGGFPDGDF